MKTVVLYAPDISCNQCRKTITKAFRALPGISRVEVDVPTQTVQVEFDERQVGRPAIEMILAKEGYPIGQVSLNPSMKGGGSSCCGSCHL